MHHGLCPGEEPELLARLGPFIGEAFGVGRPDVGEDADRGPDDGFEPFHLPGTADPGLDERQRMFPADVPHAERHAHLAVPAARAAHDVLRAAQQLVEPLLHHGLAVAPGDTDHRHLLEPPVPGRQLLEPRERIGTADRVQGRRHGARIGGDQCVAQAPRHQRLQVVVAIVLGSAQRDEQGALEPARSA